MGFLLHWSAWLNPLHYLEQNNNKKNKMSPLWLHCLIIQYTCENKTLNIMISVSLWLVRWRLLWLHSVWNNLRDLNIFWGDCSDLPVHICKKLIAVELLQNTYITLTALNIKYLYLVLHKWKFWKKMLMIQNYN